MSTNIFVGNLPYSASEEQLQHLFGAYGTVERVNLITDRETGRLKGFGFVEMSNGAQEAMSSRDFSPSLRRGLLGRQSFQRLKP